MSENDNWARALRLRRNQSYHMVTPISPLATCKQIHQQKKNHYVDIDDDDGAIYAHVVLGPRCYRRFRVTVGLYIYNINTGIYLHYGIYCIYKYINKCIFIQILICRWHRRGVILWKWLLNKWTIVCWAITCPLFVGVVVNIDVAFYSLLSSI